jgi:tape measure domain-containing protein
MELQLSTAKAQQALKQIESSLGSLQTAFSTFSSANQNGLNAVLNTLANFKGPNQQATTNIKALSSALTSIGKVQSINTLATSLNSLSRINIGPVAQNITQLSQALSSIKAPRGLSTLASSLERIAAAAGGAVGPINGVARAVNGIQPSTGLRSLANSLTNTGTSARSAANGMAALRSGASELNGVLAGLGVTLGAVGFKQFASSALESVRAVDQFTVQMKTMSGNATVAQQELGYVTDYATKMALPLDETTRSYGKLAMAVMGAGGDVAQAKGLFEGFATTFRVLGLNQEQVSRGFKAVEQIMGKGAVNMEELRQQLGELFPAFTLLAKSMGVSTGELSKLMETGKVSSKVMYKFAADLKEQFGPGLADALSKPAVAIDRFSNAFTKVQRAFGIDFFAALAPGVNALADALSSPAFQTAAQNLGTIAGTILGKLAEAFAWVIQNVPYVTEAIALFGSAFAAVKIGSFITNIIGLGSAFANLGALLSGGGIVVAIAAIAAGVWLAYQAFQALGPVVASAYTWFSEALSIAITTVAQSFATVGTAIAGLIPSFGSLIAAATSFGSSFVQVIADATNYVVQGFYAWADAAWNTINSIGAAIGSAYAYFASIINWVKQTANAFIQLWPKAVQAAYEGMVKVFNGIINAISNLINNAINKVAGAFSGWGSAASSAANAVINSIKAIIDWANRAIAALSALFSAQASAGSGESSTSVDSQRNGGISGKGNGAKQSVPMSAFAGAPRFATGGTTTGMQGSLPGGGIPAVLHPNEAVVPLTAGGAIPVSMSTSAPTAGGGSSVNESLGKAMRDELYALRDIHLDVVRTWESVDTQTALMGEGFATTNQNLVNIHNALQMMNGRFTELISAVGRSGGGGGGSSGGGSGGSSGSGSVGGTDRYKWTEEDWWIKLTGLGKASAKAMFNASNRGNVYDDIAKRIKQLMKNPYGKGSFIGGSTRYEGDYLDSLVNDINGPGKQKGVGGFATGSPNASKDVRGGFQATLHPDEAVIPLPDGRSVPINLPDSLMKKIDAMALQLSHGIKAVDASLTMEPPKTVTSGLLNRAQLRESDSDAAFINRARENTDDKARLRKTSRETTEAQRGAPSIVVQMTVNTPDAASFRASQTQILQDLKSKLDRTARTLGNSRVVDDPTRPAGKV